MALPAVKAPGPCCIGLAFINESLIKHLVACVMYLVSEK